MQVGPVRFTMTRHWQGAVEWRVNPEGQPSFTINPLGWFQLGPARCMVKRTNARRWKLVLDVPKEVKVLRDCIRHELATTNNPSHAADLPVAVAG